MKSRSLVFASVILAVRLARGASLARNSSFSFLISPFPSFSELPSTHTNADMIQTQIRERLVFGRRKNGDPKNTEREKG